MASAAAAGSSPRSAAQVAAPSSGSCQTVGLGGIGKEDAEAAGVGDHADAPAGRYRLRGQQPGDIEELGQRVGADDAGLLEQRVDGDVAAGQRRRMARRGARAGGGAARLDGDDRLAARHLGRDASELARVAEALEIQRDHRRARVVGPVGEQVVARYVGLVADRDEVGQADAALREAVEQRQPERAALRQHGDVAGRRPVRREGGVERHRRIGVEHSHAVGPHHAHAAGAHQRGEPLLQPPVRRRTPRRNRPRSPPRRARRRARIPPRPARPARPARR